MPLPANWSSDAQPQAEGSSEPLTDEEVIQRVAEGDLGSFELILRRYNQRLFRVARSIVGEDTEAEDVVQEAYFHAYQNLGQFEGRSSFATWLTRIAIHEATSRRRKQRRTRLMSSSEAEHDPMVLDSHHQYRSEDEASRNELRRVLAAAIDALPSDLRVVFTLRLVERLSTDQTAECLELTPANVKVRLHRARLQLRSWIDHRIGEETRQLFMFDGERCDRIVTAVLSRLSGTY